MSSQEFETLLRDSLLNNSYDWDAMHDQLKHTKIRSFSYLYELQQAYIEYEERFYKTTDATGHNQKLIGQMYLDKTFHACVDAKVSLISPHDREEFRLSSFYQNAITIADMIENPKIFHKIPIVMIDDKVIWDYTLYIKTDTVTFKLPFGRSFVLELIRDPGDDSEVYIDHMVKVFVVDNEMYQRSLVTKNMINYDADTGYIRFSKSDLSIVPNRSGQMFASLHLPNSAGKSYELGTSLIEMTDVGDYYEGYVDSGVRTTLNAYTSTNFYISMVFITKLNKKTFYTDTDVLTATTDTETGEIHAPLFLIDKDDEAYYQPIPVENLMVFKKNTSGNFVVQPNVDMVKLYYPNIYQIIDASMKDGDQYKIFYFYYEDSTDTKYTNIFDFYYMYLRNIFDPGTVMEEIVNTVYYALDTDKSSFFQNLGYVDPYGGFTAEELVSMLISISRFYGGDPIPDDQLVSVLTAMHRHNIEADWVYTGLSLDSADPDDIWAESAD